MHAAGALATLLALAAPASDSLPFARLALVERGVEVVGPGGAWRPAVEGAPLSPGQSLRTGREGLVQVELPWMALTLTPGSTLGFPDAVVLQASLAGGRAVVDSGGRDTLKLVTPEAEVRGRGRAVVRREGGHTLVTCLAGTFFVASGRGAVTLAHGDGTVVERGRAPGAPRPAPAPPASGLWPGRDPVYVGAGEPLELRWAEGARSYQVELLPVGGEAVLLQRDVPAPPLRIAVPWEGAFRWRVSARDGLGLEGLPSPEGLIAVAR